MNFIAVLLKLLIISYCMLFVNTSNICWNTKLVTKQRQVSYKRTFWIQVSRRCGFFWLYTCIEPKKYYVPRYRNVAYNITERYKDCCPGYEWIDDKNEQCKRKCTKHCVHGQCTETDTCICDLGYVRLNDSVCIQSICIACCTGGTCTERNVCQCNFNSTQQVNTTNSLVLCKDGYKINDSGICEPNNIPECVNSECTVPDNCTCLPGLHTTETSNTSRTYTDDYIQEQNMTLICENEDDCNSMQDFTTFWICFIIVLILSILIVISAIYFCNKKGICKCGRTEPNVKISDEYIVTNSIYGWHS